MTTIDVAFNGCVSIKYEPLLDIFKDNNSSNPSLCRVNNQSKMVEEMMAITGFGLSDKKIVFEMLHRLKDSIVRYNVRC